MGSPRYIALIGDVVASRTRQDRAEVQVQLLRRAAELSDELPPGSLATPLTLTAGDEVQALLHAEGAPETVRLIQELTDFFHGFSSTFPAIAFGVGRGTLSTGDIPVSPTPSGNPSLLDGACFQEAREALEGARHRKAWARFRGFGPVGDAALDALFDLMGAVRSGWTGNQGWITKEARRAATQKEVAASRKVSPSVISESLKAAHFESVLSGEAAARSLLGSDRLGERST